MNQVVVTFENFREQNATTACPQKNFNNTKLYSCRPVSKSFVLTLSGSQPVPNGYVITKVDVQSHGAGTMGTTLTKRQTNDVTLRLVYLCSRSVLTYFQKVNNVPVGSCPLAIATLPQCQVARNCTVWDSDQPYFQAWDYNASAYNALYLTVESGNQSAEACISDPLNFVLTVASGTF
jgi:hypothetical protein